jgi:hypothetical protein
MKSYAAKYTKVTSGYMRQLVEWPEVITEDIVSISLRAIQ